eukprot:g19174.t1
MLEGLLHRQTGGAEWPRRHVGTKNSQGGSSGGSALATALMRASFQNLALNFCVQLVHSHELSISSLDFDKVENRYLLSGGAAGRISLFDMEQTGRLEDAATDTAAQLQAEEEARLQSCSRLERRRHVQRAPTRTSTRQEPLAVFQNVDAVGPAAFGGAAALPRAVHTLQWYPFDTGLFLSGGADGKVKAWDSNVGEVAETFDLNSRVEGLHVSCVATHALIAVASHFAQVRLCDMRSGAFSHSLQGHRDCVTAVQWSPRREHMLASGSEDRAVLLWDIRRSGPLMLLDQLNRQAPSDVAARRGSSTASSLVTSHDGALAELRFSPDGGSLLSAGRDGRLRLWRTSSGLNSLVNFTGATNTHKVQRFVLGLDGSSVYYPQGSEVHIYCLQTGKRMTKTLQGGHLDRVLCLSINPRRAEIYSGGQDCLLLRWTTPTRTPRLETVNVRIEDDDTHREIDVKQKSRLSRLSEEEEDDWESSGDDDAETQDREEEKMQALFDANRGVSLADRFDTQST